MSFIRSLSNPEGLYIWDDVSGYIAITCQEHRDKIRGPIILQVNRKDWYKLLKGYHDGRYYDKGKVGTLELEEIKIPTGPWKEHSPKGTRYTGGDKKGQLMPKGFRGHLPVDFKMRLTIRNPGKRVHKIHMWRVTWDYIARHEQCPFMWGHEKRRRKK